MGIREKILEDAEVLHRFIILLADANGGPVRGRLKLQTMMYLLSDKIEEVRIQSSYDADSHGPYSEVIDAEVQYLEYVGILTGNAGEIALTQTGKETAQELSKNEDKKILKILDEYKKFLNDMTGKELLAYICSAYPNMTEESAGHENPRLNVERHVMSLVRKQKISSQRAAELLNRPQDYVIKKMNRKLQN